MNQTNAIITVDVSRLNWPLRPIYARKGHSVAARIRGVPSDVTAVFLRVFKSDGSYFDFPANERPNGEWLVYAIGTAFPAVCSSCFELHATDALGNVTALGCGVLEVEDFSVTTTPCTAGSTITVAQVPTADGSMVQIQMVQDDVGEWVYQAVTTNGGTDDE